jgi:hypothetical protein
MISSRRSNKDSEILNLLLNNRKNKKRTASSNKNSFIEQLKLKNNINTVYASMEKEESMDVEADMDKEGLLPLLFEKIPGLSSVMDTMKGDRQDSLYDDVYGEHLPYAIEQTVMDTLGVESSKKQANSAPGINQGVPSSENNPTGKGEHEGGGL